MPSPQRLTVGVHREIVQVEDAGLAAVAAAGIEVGRWRRQRRGVGVGCVGHRYGLSGGGPDRRLLIYSQPRHPPCLT